MNRRNGLIIALLIVLVAIGAVLYWRSNTSATDSSNTNLSSNDLQDKEVLVKGTIICLPYKATSPSIDQQCVKGVKGSDGKIYALDSTQINSREELLSEGTPVQAIGVYTPADTQSEEVGVWSYDGVLKVRVLNNS